MQALILVGAMIGFFLAQKTLENHRANKLHEENTKVVSTKTNVSPRPQPTSNPQLNSLPGFLPMLPDKANWTFLGVSLQSTKSEEIFKIIGPTKPIPQSDDKTHGPFIYGYYSESNPNIQVSFWGGGEDPTFFRYEFEESTQPPKTGYSKSNQFNKTTMTGGGVKLGMSQNDLFLIFPGTPTISGNSVNYKYQKLLKFDSPKPASWNPNVLEVGEWWESTIEARFENDKLKYISVRAVSEVDTKQ